MSLRSIPQPVPHASDTHSLWSLDRGVPRKRAHLCVGYCGGIRKAQGRRRSGGRVGEAHVLR